MRLGLCEAGPAFPLPTTNYPTNTMQLPLITLLLLLPHATSTTFLTIPRGGISPLTSSKIVDLDEAKTFSDVCTGAKKPFPLTIAPTDGTDAAVWAKANKDAIDKLLPEHGAILLRGFKVRFTWLVTH